MSPLIPDERIPLEDRFMTRYVVFVPGPEFGMIRDKAKLATVNEQAVKLLDGLILKNPPLVVP